jgi:hypothetical protein
MRSIFCLSGARVVKRALCVVAPVILICLLAGPASAKQDQGSGQAVADLRLPVCHNVNTEHRKTLYLPVKSTVNHLLPSIVDPSPSHLDALGDCADNPTPVEPPAVNLKHLKIPICHRQGGREEELILSVRDALYHLFLGVLIPDPAHTDEFGTCQLPPPPPPPPPPPSAP